YRAVVTCTSSGQSAVSNTAYLMFPTAPDTQASGLASAETTTSSIKVTWVNGNSSRRMVVISDSPIVDPAASITGSGMSINAAYSGSGQQVIYEGTGSTATVSNLNCSTSYNFKVYELSRCGPAASYTYYINTTTGTNQGTFSTSPMASGSVPATLNLTGFIGSNLSTIAPGWIESRAAGTSLIPFESSTSTWVQGAIDGNPTAKINLFGSTKNDWIISPRLLLSENTRLKFSAAMRDYNSSSAVENGGMVNSDDTVQVMVSTDACGRNWIPVFTFSSANADQLSTTLKPF